MRGLGSMRRSDRAAGAIWLALVWLLGMEIAPAIHLVAHRALGAHSHGGVVHVDPPDAEDELAREGEPGTADHGAGSLEHRGVAALAPAAVITPALSAPIAEMILLAPDRGSPTIDARALPPARGPPLG